MLSRVALVCWDCLPRSCPDVTSKSHLASELTFFICTPGPSFPTETASFCTQTLVCMQNLPICVHPDLVSMKKICFSLSVLQISGSIGSGQITSHGLDLSDDAFSASSYSCFHLPFLFSGLTFVFDPGSIRIVLQEVRCYPTR